MTAVLDKPTPIDAKAKNRRGQWLVYFPELPSPIRHGMVAAERVDASFNRVAHVSVDLESTPGTVCLPQFIGTQPVLRTVRYFPTWDLCLSRAMESIDAILGAP